MILIDVHAHLDMLKQLDEVLERARAAGVAAVVTQGVNMDSNKRALALAREHDIVCPALGLYPLDAPNVRVLKTEEQDYDRSCTATVDDTIAFIKEHRDAVAAIGEVGIDLKYSDDVENQVANFTKFLRLAHELRLPIIIHSRKAEKLMLNLLEEARVPRVILHCFSGSKKLVKRAVELGCTLTVMSNANRLQHFQLVAREVPLGQLLTETDAPYMSPLRGEENEPQHVRYAVEEIAKQKGLNAAEVSRALYMNYQRLFGK